jgi:hypothetical protein
MPAPKDPKKYDEWKRKNSEAHKGRIAWNKGKQWSDDTKQKISEGHKGIKASDETKQRMHESHKGFKHTEESKEKIRKSLTGKKKSKEHNEKNRESHLGQIPYNKGMKSTEEQVLKMIETKNGGLWYGAVNNDLPMTQLIRKLPEYKLWTKSVLERDEYKDVITGKLCTRPEAHHKITVATIIRKFNIKTLDDAKNCKELWDINNGITLEYENHMKIHGFNYENT